MIIKTLRELRHGKLKFLGNFWFFWGNVFRTIIIKLNIKSSCKQKISGFGPFNLHPIFIFSDFKNWGSRHNSLYKKMISISVKKRCIVDVGAHIGLHTIPVSVISAGKSEIHCFEPSESNLNFLRYHIKVNYLKNVFVNELIVGSKVKKEVIFFEKPNVSGLNSIVKLNSKGDFNKVHKKQINLDTYCKQKRIKPEVIKIDAEGSELEILNGSKITIKKYKPIIFLSFHPFHLAQIGKTIDDFYRILNELKYDIIDCNNIRPTRLVLDEYLLKPKNVK